MEPTPELSVAQKKPSMWESIFGPSTPATPAPSTAPAPVGGRKRRGTQKAGRRKSVKTSRRHRVKKHSRK